jgi:hypothetical protein
MVTEGAIGALVTFVLVSAALAAAPGAAIPAAADFVVSPQGDDAGPGTAQKPFASLDRARRAVREKVRAGLAADVAVLLRGGTYRLAGPVEFGPEDGGTPEHGVTFAAWPGERPVLSGGRPITTWKDAGDGTWLSAVPAGWRFRELFVNGRRATRARHPNDGYLRVEKVGPDKRTGFTFAAGDLRAWPDLANVELVFLHDWSTSRIRLKAVDEASRTVTTAGPVGAGARHYAMDWFEPHPRYYVENSATFLDAPGEWFLDEQAGVVSYRPMAGERPEALEAVAPAATALLLVRGGQDGARPVRNLRFVGLRFEHCAWPLPAGGFAAGQAAFHERRDGSPGGILRFPVPPAVHFEVAEDCRLENCAFERLGGSGVWFGSRTRRCALRDCVVSDVSGNGVLIGEDRSRRVGDKPWWEAAPEEAASENRIEKCIIERCGRQFFGAVGVWVGFAQGTVIARSEIRDLPYTGVSIGWMWAPTPTPCRANVVEACHIHHVMQVLSDGGGIYTLGLQPGTVLRGNLIHDVPANAGRAESNGMFLDEGTTDLVIEGNVIYNVARSPLRFHRATTNLVKGNVLAVEKGVPPVRYNATDPKNIRQVENAVIERGGEREAELRKAIAGALSRVGPAGRP